LLFPADTFAPLSLLQLFEEVGTDLAQALTTKDAIAKKKAMAPEVAKALARVSGGLYIGAPPLHNPAHSTGQDSTGACDCDLDDGSFDMFGLDMACTL
jgi:hypothetical protein